MTKPLCRCGNSLGTIAVVASMGGANWDKLGGGAALHVVVNAQEAHATNYTMYGQITSTFEGTVVCGGTWRGWLDALSGQCEQWWLCNTHHCCWR